MSDLCPICDCPMGNFEEIEIVDGQMIRRVECDSCQQKVLLDLDGNLVKGQV